MDSFERIDGSGRAFGVPDNMREAFLREGEAVHRELRPALGDEYCEYLARMFDEGAILTQLVDGGRVRALAVWRVFHTTYCGRRLEVDDLVTGAADRSEGFGAMILGWIEGRTRDLGCATVTLNSATHRLDAHRFYYRQHYGAIAFHFSKTV